MVSHNEDISNLLDAHLPAHYSTEAIKRLNHKHLGITADVIRNVRNGRPSKYYSVIIAVLVGMANEQKEADAKLHELVTSTK